MHFSTLLSVLAVSAFATASNALVHGRHAHHRFQRREFKNDTNAASVVDGAELTTATIFSTSTFFVTSCPPAVTKCPGRSTVLVTSVIAVSTTVCPVSELASATAAALASSTVSGNVISATGLAGSFSLGTAVSSAVVSPVMTASPSANSTAVAPASVVRSLGYNATIAAASSVAVNATASSLSFPIVTSTSTLIEDVETTITLVEGTSTTLVTTTLKQTNTKTVIITLGKPSSVAVAGVGASSTLAAPVASISALSTSVATQVTPITQTLTYGRSTITTTLKSTLLKTLTKTIFATKATAGVFAPGSDSGKAPAKSNSLANAAGVSATGASAIGEPTTTVHSTSTVTKFVTVSPSASEVGVSPVGTAVSGKLGSGASSACAPVVTSTIVLKQTVTVMATPSVLAASLASPYSNGTAVAPASIASTGFVTLQSAVLSSVVSSSAAPVAPTMYGGYGY